MRTKKMPKRSPNNRPAYKTAILGQETPIKPIKRHFRKFKMEGFMPLGRFNLVLGGSTNIRYERNRDIKLTEVKKSRGFSMKGKRGIGGLKLGGRI